MFPSVLDLCVYDLICCGLFHAAQLELSWCDLFCNVKCVQQWWKVWPKAIYIEKWVQNKEQWDYELEGVVTDDLGDGVWPISERAKLAMGHNKALLL